MGRRLPGGFRVDGGLGFESAWLSRGDNNLEMELQWELTAGWRWTRHVHAEAGVRWTDYRRLRREGLLRISLAHATDVEPPPRVELPEGVPDFGVPHTLVPRARLDPVFSLPPRAGRGVLLTASNPGGDPDPWNGARTGPNVDRLGLGAQAWIENGSWNGGVQWRSDLHTDPSIRDRIDPIAEGLSFPVSVSLTGGVRWNPDTTRTARIDARFDPQTFLWMPHLGAERTAELRLAEGRAEQDALGVEVRSLHLGSIAGRSVEPLTHTRGTAEAGRRVSLDPSDATGAAFSTCPGRTICTLPGSKDAPARVSPNGAHPSDGGGSARAWKDRSVWCSSMRLSASPAT